MADPISRAGVAIPDFPGLVTNMGPDASADAPGAADVQQNLAILRPGEVRARPGTQPAAFDAEET